MSKLRVDRIENIFGTVNLAVTDLASKTALGQTTGAASVGFAPAGTIASTNVQAAIVEVVTDLAAGSGSSLIGYNPISGSVTTVQNKLNQVEQYMATFDDYGLITNAVDEILDYGSLL